MKINNLFFILILFIFSGCYTGSKNYDTFKKSNNFIIQNNTSFNNYSKGYIRESYSDTHYIYIRNNNKRNVPKKCIYGFITKKDDPKQIPIRWEILSGKEYCKKQQKWILSF
ncbi:hypothetical protein [Halarcobacter bivalviorum]|uniref:Lipoprotein n=1 Tax=Halarcobacter bivalviorum TaxID=663364 RepID=A0AAX2A7H9_9BACT|nr:hypothetical protein [Halarcobacter bivalviorum]AXH11278.1 hypothetical protein ABIV_0243 [Halarcobacter bivalviorum]RXK09547.1 hypothetical protein CRV05_09585 [Halarcobacter bivalviorum]